MRRTCARKPGACCQSFRGRRLSLTRLPPRCKPPAQGKRPGWSPPGPGWSAPAASDLAHQPYSSPGIADPGGRGRCGGGEAFVHTPALGGGRRDRVRAPDVLTRGFFPPLATLTPAIALPKLLGYPGECSRLFQGAAVIFALAAARRPLPPAAPDTRRPRARVSFPHLAAPPPATVLSRLLGNAGGCSRLF